MIDRWGIIADDLTGAADSAAPFARMGFATRLALRDPLDIGDGHVVAVSTDSRSMSASRAGERVTQAALRLRELGVHRIYKKIDSTLRGNVVSELEALLAVVEPATLAVVCPAFPAVGRTVVDGRLLVGGRSVLESESARDPISPVETDRIEEFLARLGSSTLVPLTVVRAGGEELATRFGQITTDLAVVDASQESDLDAIAEAGVRSGRPVAFVGSGGLAGALAARLGSDRARASAPTLVVVGSRHGSSRQQLDELSKRQDTEVCALDVGAVDVSGAWEQQVQAVRDRAGGVVAITTAPGQPADPDRVAARLAEVAVGLSSQGIRAIVATGGDTAGAILSRADADSLDMLDEIVPGLPMGRIRGGMLAHIPIVTKSGGFGDTHLLSVAVDAAHRISEVRYS